MNVLAHSIEYRMKFYIPIKIISEANHGGHWMSAYKRKKKQKQIVAIFLKMHEFELPCHVTVTRIAPRQLDAHDNLASSLKHIVDAVANHLIPGLKPGRADGNSNISWQFNQHRGKPKEYGVAIEITHRDDRKEN